MLKQMHMGRMYATRLALAAATILAGCVTTGDPNAFLILTEDVLGGDSGSGGGGGDGGGGGGGGGGGATGQFRRSQTISLTNQEADADLNVSFLAWIGVNSVRNADQGDQLLSDGYVQLVRSVRLGVIELPPGTFVRNGVGQAGSERLTIPAGETVTRTLITPDRVLFFSSPPISCDSVAFFFTIDGELVRTPDDPSGTDGELFDGATRGAGRKTLAQIDVYDCNPLAPGMFLKTGGGVKRGNEFFEGEAIQATFLLNLPTDATPAATITVGAS